MKQKSNTIMEVNLLDAHDRYKHLLKQNFSISECCQDLIDKKPFGNHPFYIFAHQRTEDDGVNKRMIWQPRLTRPIPQTNSMLFKAYPGSDIVKIMWMIPERFLWSHFKRGMMLESNVIEESIRDFQYNRKKLEQPEPDDLTDEQIFEIYRELKEEALKKNIIATKQVSLEESSAS